MARVEQIDLGLPAGDGATSLDASVVEAIQRACRELGFFQIVGHGIPEERVEALRDAMRRFFTLPLACKREVRRSEEHAWGYYDEELTKNTPDWKEVFDFGRPPRPDLADDHPENEGVDGRNRWPRALPGFREALVAYREHCEALSFLLLDAMAAGLGDADGQLRAAFLPTHSSFVRLNHYPPCEDPAPPDAPDVPGAGHLGVNRHTDAGALTLVAQTDERGLQVRTETGWIDVEPVRGALVVNIGDMMQVWSNDRYRSPLHRVVVSRASDRFSAPFFFNPCYDAVCLPLSGLAERDGGSRYRPVSWGEFRRLRAAGDYADVGEEVQISQYRIPLAPTEPAG